MVDYIDYINMFVQNEAGILWAEKYTIIKISLPDS